MPGRNWARRRRVAIAVSVMAATLAACGVGPRRTLDARSIESEIATGLARQYQFAPGLISVTCPGAVPEVPGQAFICRASLDGQALSLDGTVTSTGGRYSIQPTSAVISEGPLLSELQSRITTQLRAQAKVTCGTRVVLVVAAGGSFSCQAVVLGQPRHVTVTVVDLKGNVRFSVAPPTSGPGATTAPQTLPAA
jgi:hypothetical protein